ncbi:MAG: antibiotic biosynthesis monooxygenase family protein [Acidimicrobiales bacterium]
MSTFVRLFATAVDPADTGNVHRLFTDDVRDAFERLPGCIGVELLMSTHHSAGGLVEMLTLSRWGSLEEMESALASRDVKEAMVRILPLFHQEPVVRVFEKTG